MSERERKIEKLTMLTPEQMAKADALTIASGTPGYDLMKNAGDALFCKAIDMAPNGAHIAIACGPGNNGGDGFVLASRLAASGYSVQLGLLGTIETLKGDAALAARDWSGAVLPLSELDFQNADLIVDALFGAGLSKPIEGDLAGIVAQMNAASAPILAVDLPTGLHGETGQPVGAAIHADTSVTFFLKKPGHLLFPGRERCGELVVADIGISQAVLPEIGSTLYENHPALWSSCFPKHNDSGHKYHRGHILVLSGPPLSTGAARLSAKAALRSGAGLVSITGPEKALHEHAAHLTSIMLKPAETAAELDALLKDSRFTAIIAGPALGVDESQRTLMDVVLQSDRKLVLDADALTLFANAQDTLFLQLSMLNEPAILTPHTGEFSRLFGTMDKLESKVEKARHAAKLSRSVVVLKGADTVIAAPDGRAAINTNAPPWLATAGSGDTLAGIIGGFRAQSMPAFEAACAGVWFHGEAANEIGPYLIADDLEHGLHRALQKFVQSSA